MTISTASSPEVLIAGAGPTGLTLATALAREGVRVRIVDLNPARSDKTKAVGVQAGTLELLERVFGSELAREMVASGRAVSEAFIHIEQSPAMRVDLSGIPSPYNFVLILAQSETERLLEAELERAGSRVERLTQLVQARQEGGQVFATLQGPHGQEQVQAAYLVGCDGAHSVVRRALGLEFRGGSYTGDFILGDVEVDWDWPYGAVRAFVSARGAMACFPMKTEKRYRLMLIPQGAAPVGTSEITLQEFKKIAATLCPGRLEIREPTWLTRFRVHHRMVKSFGNGRIFLAGDAAHIHSPVGGQGMNTGIQDALNLSDKLARVLRRGADPALLERYTPERLPIARNILRGTDLMSRFLLVRESGLISGFRSAVLPRVAGLRWFQRIALEAISQVAIARKEMKRRHPGE